MSETLFPESEGDANLANFPKLLFPKQFFNPDHHFFWVRNVSYTSIYLEAMYRSTNYPAVLFGSLVSVESSHGTESSHVMTTNWGFPTPAFTDPEQISEYYRPFIPEAHRLIKSGDLETFIRFHILKVTYPFHGLNLHQTIDFNHYPKELDETDSLERAAWFGCYFIPKNPTEFPYDSITWAPTVQTPPAEPPKFLTPENGWLFFYYRDHQTPENFGAFLCDYYEFHSLPPEVAAANYFHSVLSNLNLAPQFGPQQ